MSKLTSHLYLYFCRLSSLVSPNQLNFPSLLLPLRLTSFMAFLPLAWIFLPQPLGWDPCKDGSSSSFAFYSYQTHLGKILSAWWHSFASTPCMAPTAYDFLSSCRVVPFSFLFPGCCTHLCLLDSVPLVPPTLSNTF
jgi:hypothetical protein